MVHHAIGLCCFRDDLVCMATVLELTSPAAEFPLGTIFESLPETEVELERLIPHDTLIIPYFWVRGVSVEDIESELKTQTGVTDIRLIDSVEDEYLMRAQWENGLRWRPGRSLRSRSHSSHLCWDERRVEL